MEFVYKLIRIGVIEIIGQFIAGFIEGIPSFISDVISYIIQLTWLGVSNVALGESRNEKVISLLIDIILVLSIFFVHPLLLIMIMFVFVMATVMASHDRINNILKKNRGSVQGNSNNYRQESYEYYEEPAEEVQPSNTAVNRSFFAGLTPEEARKEYRRLLKVYHPDNNGGSTEMTLRINADYEQYLSDSAKTG